MLRWWPIRTHFSHCRRPKINAVAAALKIKFNGMLIIFWRMAQQINAFRFRAEFIYRFAKIFNSVCAEFQTIHREIKKMIQLNFPIGSVFIIDSFLYFCQQIPNFLRFNAISENFSIYSPFDTSLNFINFLTLHNVHKYTAIRSLVRKWGQSFAM